MVLWCVTAYAPVFDADTVFVRTRQVSTHNDLLPEIFQVAEGSLVKTITSIATMVQAKNGKDQYPVSACVGCMMSALVQSPSANSAR